MTTIQTDTRAKRAANFGYAALLFTLFGWANLEILLLKVNAGIRGQLLAAAAGLCLSTFAYRRCRYWCASAVLSAPAFAPQVRSKAAAIGAGCALAAAGLVLACSMRAAFFALAVICAAVLTFVPWSRIGFCRKHFLVSQGLLMAGGLPALVFATHQHPINVLAYTWLLWTCAAGLVMSALCLQNPRFDLNW